MLAHDLGRRAGRADGGLCCSQQVGGEGVVTRPNLSITRPYGGQMAQTRAFFVRTRTTCHSLFPCFAKFDAKMATPETFSETGSETMYEKV